MSRRDQISEDHPPPFRGRGVQAECIKLNGAIELAPRLGLCRHIVDLVQTGATLRANGLVEIEPIAEISSRLIVNRPALKTRPEEVGGWIERFRAAVGGLGPDPPSALQARSPSPAVREGNEEGILSPLSRTAGEGGRPDLCPGEAGEAEG